ncbi:unnamed protein product [Pylaiella littoralis]
MSTTVTWVLDSNSKYEISSKDHLVQLMNSGALYTNAGSAPTDFMSADYVQTADIDLLNDSANIKPIGVTASKFKGEYDGNSFTISNWSYTDPNFGTTTATYETYVGLFGETSLASLKNIRMAGVCVLEGYGSNAGMIGGQISDSTISNVECDFAPGSSVSQGTGSGTWLTTGGVVGLSRGGSAYGITLRGELEMHDNTGFTSRTAGGVFGQMNQTTVTLVRNLATFPSGVNGTFVGGVVGYVFFSSFEKGLNAMKGDVSGTKNVGGVVGYVRHNNASQSVHTLINSMQGNVSGPGSSAYVGGIVGLLDHESNLYHTFLNYMAGDITCELTLTNRCGGLVGRSENDPNIATSINAMKGYVDNTVVGTVSSAGVASSASLAITVDASFGLTYLIDDHSTTSAVTGLPTDPDYYDLPFASLDGTDGNGVVYAWAFVYGNDTALDLTPRPLSIKASFGAVGGATAYRLTVQKASGDDDTVRTVHTGFTDLVKNIHSLTPETEYIVRLYSTTDGAQYDLHLEDSATTTANSVGNHQMSDFRNQSGAYDLSEFDAGATRSVYEIANELFATGDAVVVSVGGRAMTSKFVKRGETASIVGESALLLPFESTAGTSQSASLTLSDNSSVTLTFDENVGTIGFEGAEYSPGDFVVVDGRKMTFAEV